jgi:hypothetical protein
MNHAARRCEILSTFRELTLESHSSTGILSAAFECRGLDRSASEGLYLALVVAAECTIVTADGSSMPLSRNPLADHIQ